MALITRISRLFKADFHAVLDQIEEPEMLLKQAIREMDESLSEAEQHHQNTLNERESLQIRHDALTQEIDDLNEELDICFESNEDDLARDLLRRKLEKLRLLKCIVARQSALKKDLGQQYKSIEDNRATLESMRQKAELFAERLPNDGTCPSPVAEPAWGPRDLRVNDNEVEVAFLREKKRRAES